VPSGGRSWDEVPSRPREVRLGVHHVRQVGAGVGTTGGTRFGRLTALGGAGYCFVRTVFGISVWSQRRPEVFVEIQTEDLATSFGTALA